LREKIRKIVARDPRYAAEAYYFVLEAYEHAAARLENPLSELKTRPNISGAELLNGVRTLALDQFGYAVATVFRKWGIKTSEDIGEIVFNMVDHGGMNKSPEDSKDDFAGGADFVGSLEEGYDFSGLSCDLSVSWDPDSWNIRLA